METRLGHDTVHAENVQVVIMWERGVIQVRGVSADDQRVHDCAIMACTPGIRAKIFAISRRVSSVKRARRAKWPYSVRNWRMSYQ